MMLNSNFNTSDKIYWFDGDYEWLSNFYPSILREESEEAIIYPTVEHFYQAMKTTDSNIRRRIAAQPTPGRAKRLGNQIKLREDWESIKYDVMADAIRGKFEHPDLRKKLLDTAGIQLEEGNNWHDNTWGNCYCKKCQFIEGKNWLGKILMAERDKLLNEGG